MDFIKAYKSRIRIVIWSFCFRICAILLILSISNNYALTQQQFQSALSFLDKYDWNPAYGGMGGKLNLTARYRNQWQGIPGNPRFVKLNAHLPLFSINGGAGFQLWKQDIGASTDLHTMFTYNQVFNTSFGLLSIGLRTGLLRKSLDGSALISESGLYEDRSIFHNDGFIPNTKISGNTAVWGIGLLLLREKVNFGIVFDDFPLIAIELDGIDILKRYAITFQGDYMVYGTSDLNFNIFGLLRSDFIKIQSELGIRGSFRQNYFLAMQLRGYDSKSLDALSLSIGGKVNEKLLIAYNYEFTLSKIRKQTNGSHGILISYLVEVNTGKSIPEKIIHSPRLYD